MKKPSRKEDAFTVIGSNASLEGKLNDSQSVYVEGHLYGDITTEGEVHIGRMGFVRGNVKGSAVYIWGKVEGNVEAREVLEIHPGGTLEGDLVTKRLIVHDGAVFIGRSQMEEVVLQGEREHRTLQAS